ncbi:unnamed protein product, partial [Rotaria socialis]
YYDDDNNGGYDPNALCSEDPTTSAMVCTCNAGYTNTGSADNVVCTDMRSASEDIPTDTVSASEEIRTDTGSASGDIRTGTVSVSKKKKYFAIAFLCCAKCCLVLRSSSVHL